MTIAHRRAARRELAAAKALGVARVHRRRYERAPDIEPIRLASGVTLIAEIKTRRRLPRLIVDALQQAAGYMPPGAAIPIAIVSELGGEAIVCLRLADFVALVGVSPARLPAQTSIVDAIVGVP